MKLRRGGHWATSAANDRNDDMTNDDFLLPDEEFPESAFADAPIVDNGSVPDEPLLQNSNAASFKHPIWFVPRSWNHQRHESTDAPILGSAHTASFRKSDDLSEDEADGATMRTPGIRILGISEPKVVRKEVRFDDEDFQQCFFSETPTVSPDISVNSPSSIQPDDLVYSPNMDVPDVLEPEKGVNSFDGNDCGVLSLANDHYDSEEDLEPIDVQQVTGILKAAHQQELRDKKEQEMKQRKRKTKTSSRPSGWKNKRANVKKPKQQRKRHQRQPSTTDASSSGARLFPRGVLKNAGTSRSAVTSHTKPAATPTRTVTKPAEPKSKTEANQASKRHVSAKPASTTSPAATTAEELKTTANQVSKRRSGRSLRDVIFQTTWSNEEEANSIMKSESSGEGVRNRTSSVEQKSKNRQQRRNQRLSKRNKAEKSEDTKQRSWAKRLPSFEGGLFRRSKRKTKTSEPAPTVVRDSSTGKSSVGSRNKIGNLSDNDESRDDSGIAGMIARAFGDPWEEDSIEEYTGETNAAMRLFRKRGDDTVSYSASSAASSSVSDDDSDDFASDLRSAMDDFLDSSCACCTPARSKVR